MKRIFYFCLIIPFLVGILYSCKKSETPDKINTISEDDLKLERLILSFKDRLKAPFKSGDSITVDSAVWYLETLANYEYGDASTGKADVSIDSFEIILLSSLNGIVSVTDVDSVYNTMIDSIRKFYHSIPIYEKDLLSVNIADYMQQETNIVLTVQSIIVTGLYTSNFIFEPWESWWYGEDKGMCNYQFYGKDAASEITRRVMCRKPVPVGNYYYTQTYGWHSVPTSVPVNPNAPPSNYIYYYLYYNTTTLPDPHICLQYEPCDELNFYLLGAEHLAYSTFAQGGFREPGFDFTACDIYDRWHPHIGTNIIDWWHEATFFYGILHQSSNPPKEL